jgi:uncharacterized membrane protein YdjX (TVP38/TMEM64 family)
MTIEQDRKKRPGLSWQRLLPLLLLIAGLVAFFAFGLNKYLTFETLRQNRAWLLQAVADSAVLATLAYIALYIVVVAFSLPGGAVMTITGGFLFGEWLGTAYVIFAATVGATILFLAARTALGDALRAKAGPFLKKMETGFQENALNYLLVLRLIPIFPFFIVNLVPAFLGVRLRDFVIATFIGIIPGSFVYATVGAGLGSIFDAGGQFSARSILTPEIVTALAGLAILALLPVAYKKMKSKGDR